jgi:uncharacterized protein (UPF0332 family)
LSIEYELEYSSAYGKVFSDEVKLMLMWEQWRSKSEASMLAARNSLSADDLAAAVSRAYFASFQAVTCALVKSGYQPPVDTGN